MILGTRGSALAVAQAETAIKAIRKVHPSLPLEIKKIRTVGDNVTDRPLSALGGYGAFTKELDQRLLAEEIDVAVNSLKDMPVDLTPGTAMAAVLPRARVEDVLISHVPFDELSPGAVVGTSSVRRAALVKLLRPDLEVRDLRGNVPTRLKKWKDGSYDAIILARAGLDRLGLEQECFVLDPDRFVPAVGQGAIALICRAGSEEETMLRPLDDRKTHLEVYAERSVMRALGGGCSVPVGVLARLDGESIRIRGSVIKEGGKASIEVDRLIRIDQLDEGLRIVARDLAEGMGGVRDDR
jgi:hydroxymethylbilane synthase